MPDIEMPSSVLTAALDKSWQEMRRGHIVSFAVHSGTLVSRAWVEDRVLCVLVEQGEPEPFSVRMATLDVYLVPQHQAVRGDLFAVGAAAGMPIAVPRGFVREPS